ncbi:beta-propeller fold lactonase family protein [Cellulosimicrobium terreum]|nr:beta-propeller fold lactonase family protein [Cellulosimicrobium terreum]
MTSATRSLWIGTYPHPAAETAEGIWHAEVDVVAGRFQGARLAARSPASSFLALSGDVLYAVAEQGAGAVRAFRTATDGSLSPLGPPVPTGGDSPCHVVVVPGAALVANYGDGVLSVVPVRADGSLAGPARRQGHAGSGPDPDRQEGPHAHFVATTGAAGSQVLVVDLGTDELRRHDPAAPDGAVPGVAATFPAGTGPRHLVELADGHLVVVGELDPALFVLAPTGRGRYDVVARYDVSPAVHDGPRSYPSHVALTADGTRLVVGVRGADVLSVHAVEAGPVLRHLGDVPTGGSWPRHLAILRPGVATTGEPSHDLVVVANQNDAPASPDLAGAGIPGPTSSLALVRLDRATGAGEVLDTLVLPAPACVVEGDAPDVEAGPR